MRTTDELSLSPRPIADATFLRRLALLNGAVPAVLLAVDAARSKLGVNAVSYAIHTTGTLALVFFLLALAVTPLKRLTGWNALVAMRRTIGLYGFFYLCAHFVLFFLFDRERSITSTLSEIFSRRYLFIGTVALLFFAPLAATSTDGMITRLGPRRWKRLHRLAYLATALGVVHFLLLVKADIRKPVAFGVALGVLLALRLVKRRRTKARAVWTGELRVERITEETHDVRTFRLVLPAGGPIPFEHQAGQYLNIELDVGGTRTRRSYTISSPATERDHVDITVKRTEKGWVSAHLHFAVKEGMNVRVSAPAGRFTFDETTSDRVLLIAGGVGITPLMAILRTLAAKGWTGQIDLVYSAKTEADLVFGSELQALAARFPKLRVHPLFTRAEPRRKIDKELLARVVPDLRYTPIYLCGPDAMMAAVRSLLLELGAPATNIQTEAFVSASAGPTTSEAEDEAVAADGPRIVQFARTGESAELSDEQTLLDAADEAGVDIPADCRSGVCGQCKTQLLRGRVVMDNQDALSASDRKRRLILACQARPVGAVVIDA